MPDFQSKHSLLSELFAERYGDNRWCQFAAILLKINHDENSAAYFYAVTLLDIFLDILAQDKQYSMTDDCIDNMRRLVDENKLADSLSDVSALLLKVLNRYEPSVCEQSDKLQIPLFSQKQSCFLPLSTPFDAQQFWQSRLDPRDKANIEDRSDSPIYNLVYDEFSLYHQQAERGLKAVQQHIAQAPDLLQRQRFVLGDTMTVTRRGEERDTEAFSVLHFICDRGFSQPATAPLALQLLQSLLACPTTLDRRHYFVKLAGAQYHWMGDSMSALQYLAHRGFHHPKTAPMAYKGLQCLLEAYPNKAARTEAIKAVSYAKNTVLELLTESPYAKEAIALCKLSMEQEDPSFPIQTWQHVAGDNFVKFQLRNRLKTAGEAIETIFRNPSSTLEEKIHQLCQLDIMWTLPDWDDLSWVYLLEKNSPYGQLLLGVLLMTGNEQQQLVAVNSFLAAYENLSDSTARSVINFFLWELCICSPSSIVQSKIRQLNVSLPQGVIASVNHFSQQRDDLFPSIPPGIKFYSHGKTLILSDILTNDILGMIVYYSSRSPELEPYAKKAPRYGTREDKMLTCCLKGTSRALYEKVQSFISSQQDKRGLPDFDPGYFKSVSGDVEKRVCEPEHESLYQAAILNQVNTFFKEFSSIGKKSVMRNKYSLSGYEKNTKVPMLTLLAYYGSFDILEKLSEIDESLLKYWVLNDLDYYQAIYCAATRGHLNVLNLLLPYYREEVTDKSILRVCGLPSDERGGRERYVLFSAVAGENHLAVMKALFNICPEQEKQRSINANSYRAFYYAVCLKNHTMMDFLWEECSKIKQPTMLTIGDHSAAKFVSSRGDLLTREKLWGYYQKIIEPEEVFTALLKQQELKERKTKRSSRYRVSHSRSHHHPRGPRGRSESALRLHTLCVIFTRFYPPRKDEWADGWNSADITALRTEIISAVINKLSVKEEDRPLLWAFPFCRCTNFAILANDFPLLQKITKICGPDIFATKFKGSKGEPLIRRICKDGTEQMLDHVISLFPEDEQESLQKLALLYQPPVVEQKSSVAAKQSSRLEPPLAIQQVWNQRCKFFQSPSLAAREDTENLVDDSRLDPYHPLAMVVYQNRK